MKIISWVGYRLSRRPPESPDSQLTSPLPKQLCQRAVADDTEKGFASPTSLICARTTDVQLRWLTARPYVLTRCCDWRLRRFGSDGERIAADWRLEWRHDVAVTVRRSDAVSSQHPWPRTQSHLRRHSLTIRRCI